MQNQDEEVSININELKGALLTFVFTVFESNGQLQFEDDLSEFEVNDTGLYFKLWDKSIDTVGMASYIAENEPDVYADVKDDTEAVLRKYIEVHHGSPVLTLPAAVVDKFRETAKSAPRL